MFHIDCEGALSLDYMEMLYRFDDFALEMVEQPLAAEDLVAHAMLQESLRTPICLDESIASPLQAEMALDLKSCRHVNLKAGRVGGLTAALKILEACQAADVRLLGRRRSPKRDRRTGRPSPGRLHEFRIPGRFLSLRQRTGRGPRTAADAAPHRRWRGENRPCRGAWTGGCSRSCPVRKVYAPNGGNLTCGRPLFPRQGTRRILAARRKQGCPRLRFGLV